MGLQSIHLRLRFTEDAERAVARRLEESSLSNPVIGIIWGRWDDELEDHWLLGIYNKPDLRVGWLVTAGDVEFYTIKNSCLRSLMVRSSTIVTTVCWCTQVESRRAEPEGSPDMAKSAPISAYDAQA